MGGDGANLRANAFAPDGAIWVTGHSPGPEWPPKNPYPNAGKGGARAGQVFARFLGPCGLAVAPGSLTAPRLVVEGRRGISRISDD
jgi:hypothetical protein